MPDDVNTEEYSYPLPLVERDQWELAFEPMKADPYAALNSEFISQPCESISMNN